MFREHIFNIKQNDVNMVQKKKNTISSKHYVTHLHSLNKYSKGVLSLSRLIRAVALGQWVKLPAWKAGLSPAVAFKFQRNKLFLPYSLVKIEYCGKPQ